MLKHLLRSNFNHERWAMCCGSARAQRMIVEECLKWVNQRKAFGKPLSSQAVIRSKLAQMISRAEASQTWLENITYQMCNMVSPLNPPFLAFASLCPDWFTCPPTVVQGAGDEAGWADRVPQVVQHAVRAGDRQGRGAALRRPRHHADGHGTVRRARA